MKIDQFETDALMDVAARPPLVFVEGRGSWLIDHTGRRYLDFVQGWAVNALGHCPPEIASALAAQAQRLISPSPAFFNDAALALAQRLAQLSGLARVFLASSGAEANEGAIKLARKWGALHRGGAFEIITFADGVHGRTLATMAASGKAGWDKLFEPKVPGFPKARFNELGSVRDLVGPTTVAVSAACLAQDGHDVTGIDVDPFKVNLINKKKSPIVEPGLGDLIKKVVTAGKLKASSNGAGPADVSIVCVGTPSNRNGSLQLDYIKRVAEQIGSVLKKTSAYHVVNIRSTVLPGTVEVTIIPILEERSQKRAGKDFGVCMNPEFLREGTSIKDYYHPPLTVIGQIDKKSGAVVEKLYGTLENAPVVKTAIRVAEMVKYT